MSVHLETHRFGFLLIFLLLILVAGSLVAFVYLPKATIVIHPATTSRIKEQEIILSDAAKEPDFVRFILPGQAITKEIEVSNDVVRTGAVTRDGLARGQVVLHNDQVEPQSLLPKTNLRHEASGVFFLTDSPLKIPPESTVSVGVTAKEPGANGNVPAGKFVVDKLPLALQKVVYGVSDLPFGGGTIVETPLTQDEISKAQKGLETEAKTEALAQLTGAAAGKPIRPDLLFTNIISQASSEQPGSLASAYTVTVKFSASAFLVDDNDLLGLTLLALRSSLRPDEEFVAYDPRSFNASLVATDPARGQAKIKGKLTGTYAQKISPNAIQTTALAGLKPAEVEEELKKFPGIGKVEVKLAPFWVKTVPARAGAVTTVVENKK
ncbi:MAG: hypothetical protein HYZ63_01940 [Candidatus Andersenbacteria bacterium]|nr:hypothetical protein [Candidatus Andersenbacteria bacterium]